MLENRVKETSTTTGTGNITLDGAVTGFKTFNTSFGLGPRFSYWINSDANTWETGIGYLSGTTTLVRETVLGNSSGTIAALSFTGNLTILVNEGSSTTSYTQQGQSLEGTLDFKAVSSAHLTRNAVTTVSLIGTRVHFMPFWLMYGGTFDALLASITTASGSAGDIFLGLYSRDSDGLPDKLIVSNATSLDPETTGLQAGTFTEQSIPQGWYFICVTCDVTFTALGNFANYNIPPNLGSDTASGMLDVQYMYYIDGSLTALPATVGARTWSVFTSSTPSRIMLRPTS